MRRTLHDGIDLVRGTKAFMTAVIYATFGVAIGLVLPVLFTSSDAIPLDALLFVFAIATLVALPYVVAIGAVIGIPMLMLVPRRFRARLSQLLVFGILMGAPIGIAIFYLQSRKLSLDNAVPGAMAGLAAALGWWQIALRETDRANA